ncbi:MAG TPA: hypothetical protein VFW23_07465 [Tepidisphaeraceae bacterium]|nr:hypothetical protein [Tepidisphaeraceae bacterium]
MAVTAPIVSRADEAHDKDHPKLDGSIEQVLNQLSDRFHVHVDADWNELQAAGVSPQFSLRQIPARTLDDGLAAVVSATHFRLTYVATPSSVRISASALANRPPAAAAPAGAQVNSIAPSDDAKSDDVLDRLIPDLNLDSITLEDAFSQLGEATHATILVRWRDLKDASIGSSQKIRLHLWNVSLRTALRVILAEIDDSATPQIGFTVDNDGVLDVCATRSISDHGVIRFFNVRDIVQGTLTVPPPDGPTRQECVDSLIKLITDSVSPDSWRDAGGSIGAIKEINGVLVVTQSVQSQKEIEALLSGLRQHGVTK